MDFADEFSLKALYLSETEKEMEGRKRMLGQFRLWWKNCVDRFG